MDDYVESPMDVLGQPSANEGQYFSDRDASALIRDLLAGSPPDNAPSEVVGPYRDVIDNLRVPVTQAARPWCEGCGLVSWSGTQPWAHSRSGSDGITGLAGVYAGRCVSASAAPDLYGFHIVTIHEPCAGPHGRPAQSTHTP